MRRITAAECKSITKPGFYRADETLYLYVKKTGRRSWVQRVTIEGRRHDIGLGSFPVVSLAKARRRALDNRVLLEESKDSLLVKRRPKTPTFKEATESVHETILPTFLSEQQIRDWISIQRKHVFPELAKIRLDRITQQDVLAVLNPIWTENPETALKVRQLIRNVLDHCRLAGYVRENVADERLDSMLPTMP